MSASPKDKRESPTRNFEDYVLTYEVGPEAGLYPILNTKMRYIEGNVGLPFTDDATSDLIDLGFDFKFEDKIYTKIVVNTNGWCCLVDPARNSFVPSEIMTDDYANHSIKDVFDYSHIMISPWSDDLKSIFRSPYDVGVNNYYNFFGYTSPSQREQIKEAMVTGKKSYLNGFDATLGGVKIHNENSSLGRCLIIRWKFFTYFSTPVNIGTCDIVFYENGTIEFRYAPRQIDRYVSNESATVGIFSYGGQIGYPRYRDFARALVENDSRGEYTNGGSIYDGVYTNSGAKYNCTLNSFLHWPGLGQYGAIFRFSPPQIRRRQNRSITTIRDSVSFTNRDGSSLFNDQLALSPASSQLVEYPSMMPVSFRTSANYSDPVAINSLYSSGSIQVNRTFKPELVDSALYDSLIEGRYRRK